MELSHRMNPQDASPEDAVGDRGLVRGVLFGLLYVVAVAAAIAAAAWIGRGWAERQWGAEGVASMWAAAKICMAAGLIAAAPLPLVAAMSRTNLGYAVFAGTVIRLLATMAMMVGYQMTSAPHMRSFLSWMVILYLVLLAVETGMGVALVRRTAGAGARGKE